MRIVWPREKNGIRLADSSPFFGHLMTDATIPDASTVPPRQSFARQLAEVLLIALVFFIVAGDPTPHVNEAHYLCRLKHFWNPAWCPKDLFLNSTDTQTIFIWSLGWVTRWLSLAATAWVGRVISWGLLAWAWQRLSWRLVPQPLAAVLSAALFVTLIELGNFAGEWVVGGVEAKCFAYVCVLLALRELIDGRWNWVWGLLGAATAWHPLVGGWSGLVCGGIWLLHERSMVSLRAMLPGVIVGGLLGLVGVLPALSLTWNEPADVVAEANRIYVFDRLPHHLAPLTLPTDEITRKLWRFAMVLASLVVLGRMRRRAGEASSEVGLQRVVEFAWGAVLIAAVGLGIELVLKSQPLLASRLLRYYWFRLADIAAPLAVALLATAIIASGLQRRRAWAVLGLAAAIAFTGWHLASTARELALNPIAPADSKMKDQVAWADVCDWITENTPEDAVFLTPRLSTSFKWRTGRSEVVTMKDIPQDASSMVEWYRRLNDVFYEKVYGKRQPIESIGRLGTERVRELAKKYGAKYVLADRGELLRLPTVYPTPAHPNEEYVVYRIDDETADGK